MPSDEHTKLQCIVCNVNMRLWYIRCVPRGAGACERTRRCVRSIEVALTVQLVALLTILFPSPTVGYACLYVVHAYIRRAESNDSWELNIVASTRDGTHAREGHRCGDRLQVNKNGTACGSNKFRSSEASPCQRACHGIRSAEPRFSSTVTQSRSTSG